MPRRLTVLAALLIAVGTGVLTTLPSPKARADSPNGYCHAVKVYAARGSGESYTDSEAGMGPEMYKLYNQIKTALKGVDVVGSGVPYPATPFDKFWAEALLDAQQAVTDTINALNASIQQGVDDLFELVDSEAAICPNEKIVLIGYSQGAAVIGDYLNQVGGDGAAFQSVIAAVMWADPRFNPTSHAAFLLPDSSGTWGGGILGTRGEYPEPFVERTQSYCLRDDPVCNSTFSNILGAILPCIILHQSDCVHGSYPSTTVPSTSISWITQAVYDNLPAPGPGPTPTPAPTPTPTPTPPPPPPSRTGLFVYNQSSGASYVELPGGAGDWLGVPGPKFSAGWKIYTGDFNADGFTDLFDYNPTSGASYVDLADGSGGWTGVQGPQFSAGWNVYTGKLTSNGRTDLFLYNPNNGASYVELADGSGGWTGAKGPQFSAGWNVYTGDFTGNGLTDLFVYNPTNGNSYVELANGNGGWTGVKGPQFSAGWNVYTGDFTGNGLTDLFAYNPTNGNSYVELADGSGSWTGVKGPTFSTGWSIYTGKFTSSGRTDLFAYSPTNGNSYVELANGSGGWTGVKGPQFSAGWSIYTGDFTGNGRTDLFDYNPTTGASYVDLANGSGGWTGVKGPQFSSGWNVYTGVFDKP